MLLIPHWCPILIFPHAPTPSLIWHFTLAPFSFRHALAHSLFREQLLPQGCRCQSLRDKFTCQSLLFETLFNLKLCKIDYTIFIDNTGGVLTFKLRRSQLKFISIYLASLTLPFGHLASCYSRVPFLHIHFVSGCQLWISQDSTLNWEVTSAAVQSGNHPQLWELPATESPYRIPLPPRCNWYLGCSLVVQLRGKGQEESVDTVANESWIFTYSTVHMGVGYVVWCSGRRESGE